MKLWIQYPRFPRHSFADFFLPVGAPTPCQNIPKVQKSLDWFFAGQRNRREECLEVLQTLPNGFLLETDGFAQGLPAQEYYSRMASARFVPCPAGAHADTFRVWEALECGSIPIVKSDQYWQYHSTLVLNVDSWHELKWILRDQRMLSLAANWWNYQALKQQIISKMKEHLCELMTRSQ